MRNAALLALAALMISVPAYCYEFHLLNDMVVKGDVTGFSDGRFHVQTDIGRVSLEASKLDYIIVEEADGIPGKGTAPGVAPGMYVDAPGQPAGSEPVHVRPEAVPTPPAPLAGHTLLPPHPLGGWTLASPSGRQFYPGQFRGERK